jgi:iron(III) transport system permease protein
VVKRIRAHLSFWSLSAVGVSIAVLLPLVAIILMALSPEENIWPHLASTMLPRYLQNTFQLMLGVAVCTAFLGISTAWLVTMCQFPGRRIFEWALLLPLAAPSYVVAFVYTDFLEYSGPIQSMLRAVFGWSTARDYWFPDIRTLGGAIFVMSFTLYPYVYMLTRAMFVSQSVCVLEAGRTLGCSPKRTFFRIALPLVRPAVIAGVSLALMETLNDFATVEFFGVHTLTAGVYDIWTNMSNAGGAAQVSLVMLCFVLALVGIERFSRRNKSYAHSTSTYNNLPRYALRRHHQVLAVAVCALPILIGFLSPALILLKFALARLHMASDSTFQSAALHSLALSLGAALTALFLALILSYGNRLSRNKVLKFFARLCGLGYAVPGAVLAIGIFIPFAMFDNALDRFMRSTFDVSTGLILSGTAVAIVFAYAVRFLAVALGAIDSGLERVRPSIEDAARTLGAPPRRVLFGIHLPLIRPSLLAGLIVVFVDCLKELPATLILRPFNFETLATYVYQYAADELIEDAALGALAIVVAGIIPVIMISRAISAARPGANTAINAPYEHDTIPAAAPHAPSQDSLQGIPAQ